MRLVCFHRGRFVSPAGHVTFVVVVYTASRVIDGFITGLGSKVSTTGWGSGIVKLCDQVPNFSPYLPVVLKTDW